MLEIAALAAGLAVAAVGVAGAILFGTYLLHEISLVVAVLGFLLAGSVLGPRFRPGSLPGAILHRVVPPLVVVAATCYVYWYLVTGEMPWSHDHPVHLFHAWQLGERLIPSGRLMGWSHFLWAGYPSGTLYPILSDLLVVVVRWLTFGQASWPTAYAWALLVMLLLYHLGIYALGLRWFGPWAGVVGAVFALMDRGAPREGSYYWTILYGVWPMALGTALWFFALERLLALLERPTRWRVVAFAVLQGLALLGHPMTLTFSAIVFPTVMILHVLREPPDRTVVPMWISIGALGVGSLLAAFWYLPFAASSDLVLQYGDAWWTLPEVGERLAGSALFEATLALPIALGLGGAVLAWTHGARGPREVTVVTAVLMIAISSTVYQALDPGRTFDDFNVIHFRRFTYALKMLWFLLAGYAVVGAAGLVRESATAPDRPPVAPWRKWALILLAAAVFTPIVESFVLSIDTRAFGEIGSPKPLDEQNHSVPFRDANEWFAKNVKPTDPFFRIMYDVGGSRHLFNASPLYTGRPAIVVMVDVPVLSFARRFRDSSSSTLLLQQVRYVVTFKDHFATREDLREVYRKDILRIYEVKDYRPEPFTVYGDARVKVLEFGDERIRLAVRDPGPGDTLTLHVTHTDDWHAYLDGQPLEIHEVEGNRHVRWLMNVPLDKEGTLEFVYERGPVDCLGKAVSILALLIVALVAFGDKLARRLWLVIPARARIGRILSLIAGPALAGAAAASAVAVVAVLAWAGADDASYRLSDHLEDAAVTAVSEGGKIYECFPTFDRRIQCDAGQTQFVYKGAKRSGKDESRIVGGILVRPFFELHTKLRFPRVRLGNEIAVTCGSDYLEHHGKGTLEVLFSFGSTTIGKVDCPAAGTWKEQRFSTAALEGRRGTLVVDIANCSKPSPRLILDARILP